MIYRDQFVIGLPGRCAFCGRLQMEPGETKKPQGAPAADAFLDVLNHCLRKSGRHGRTGE